MTDLSLLKLNVVEALYRKKLILMCIHSRMPYTKFCTIIVLKSD